MTLHKCKFVYAITVDAPSHDLAHKAVCKAIKANPSMVISSIEDAKYGQHRSLWRMLLWGK